MSSNLEVTRLKDALDSLLFEGACYKEFDLIQSLQTAPYCLFDKNALSDQLTLFQTHFLIYHCLYLLRQEYLADKKGYLIISALDIRLIPHDNKFLENEGEQKLSDYYLDLEHLDTTQEKDVQDLLNAFWQRMGNLRQTPVDAASVHDANVFFDVSFPDTDWSDVKQRYRKTMHSLHPDKGGDKHEAQKAQSYFDILRSAYGK